MRSVLLLGANFFPVNKIALVIALDVLALNGFVLRQDTSHTGWILGPLIFLEAHGHGRRLTAHWWWSNASNNADGMVVVCHFEYFLLLSSQTVLIWIRLIFLLTVHVSESHGSRHEYVVVLTRVIIRPVNLAPIRRLNSLLVNVIIMVLLKVVVQLVEVLVLLLRVLVAVVSYISALLTSTTHCPFLIVAVEILNVKTTSSLVVSETSHWSCFQALVLCSCSALGVEVLS